MSTKKTATSHPGVRYRIHPSRKHGIHKDKYFFIRYRDTEGKLREEGVGWASEGMSPQKAADIRSQLITAKRTGDGPTTLRDIREEKHQEDREKQAEQRRQELLNVSFDIYFRGNYLPEQKAANKPETCIKTEQHVRIWIEPVVRDIPMREITPAHVKSIRRNLQDAERSLRYIQYIFTTFNAIWRAAYEDEIVTGKSPAQTRNFKNTLPRLDNKKERFLTFEEEKMLLQALKERSRDIHDMAIVSLDCGLRWGEITALTWDRVNRDHGILHLTHTKSGKSRWVPTTWRVNEILRQRGPGSPGSHVFTARNGDMISFASATFSRTVKEIGLNDGVNDNKLRISFHSLRHTYASRLLEAGASIYEVSKLLGHGSVTVTERYGHLVQGNLETAVKRMEIFRQNKSTKTAKVLTINNG